MKKFTTAFIAIFLLGLTSFSQTMTITYEGNDITKDTVFLDIPLDQGINHYFYLHNGTASTYDVWVTKTEICKPATLNHLWCFGDQCYLGTTSSIKQPMPASGQIEFHIGPIGMTDNNHGYMFYYVFYPELNPADSVWFWMANDPNGDCSLSSQMLVNAQLTKLSVYPNPAETFTNLEYKTNSDNSSFDIYNIIGEKVKSVKLKGKEGNIRINTSDLPAGTYIGTMVESGIKTKSIKLIISN